MSEPFLHPLFDLSEESLHCFSVFGRALHTAQRFEQNVKTVARAFAVRTGDLDDDGFLEQLAKKTKLLGGAERLLSDGEFISDWGVEGLKAARDARNELAHEAVAFIEHGGTSEWEEFTARVQVLVHAIASADALLCSLMHFMNTGQAIGDRHLTEHVRRVEDWVAEETFA